MDGLGYGQSTKAAILRRGLVETYRFANWLFPDRGVQIETTMASCGFGDIMASAYGGGNRRCAEAFAKTGKPFAQPAAELLNGQKLAGTVVASEISGIFRSSQQSV